MKNRTLLLLLSIIIITLFGNSCKKAGQSSIQTLFTNGTWQLASLQVYNFVGDTLKRTDTLNTNCTLKQSFTFKADNTCTYQNFSCIEQAATGQWSLSRTQLVLMSTLTCKDTTSIGTSRPFENTQILNLGQYSMVLQTGDTEANFPPTKKRRIVRYGFIRQK